MNRRHAIALLTAKAALGASLAMGFALSPATAAHTPQALALPACEYEDGNPDGLPCLWTDPDTGALYYSDSADYA